MIDMIRKAITITALAATAMIATPAQASTPTPHGVIRTALNTPCQYEDSTNCFWDAGASGNNKGHSFYSIKVGHKVCTIYWDRAFNRRHGFCD